MRAFCTVSAPLEGCAPPTTPLVPGSRFLALKLLGSSQPLYFLVEAKSRVREVYAQTCLHFAKQGMLDTELFGLAVLSGKHPQPQKLKAYMYERLSLTLSSTQDLGMCAGIYPNLQLGM